jgi:hypothetical protein
LNAESVHNCLFVENPKSKNLEKSLRFKLAAKASVSLVIVLKAPKIKKLDFLSYVTVRQVVSQNQSALTRTEKTIKAGKVHRQQTRVEEIQRVLVVGKLENPQLFCCKAIFEEKAQEFVIPLCIKRGESIHKFKVPFMLSN